MISKVFFAVAVVVLACFSMAGAAVSDKCQQAFQEQILRSHNDFRGRHGVAPLKANGNSQASQESATKTDPIGDLPTKSGESLFVAWRPTADQLTIEDCARYGKKAVFTWYDEINSYDFTTNKAKKDAGRIDGFAQILWEDTTEFSAFLSTSVLEGNTAIVVVAKYKNSYKNENDTASNKKNIVQIGSRIEVISAECKQAFNKQMLEQINAIRADHSVEPLVEWENNGLPEWTDYLLNANTHKREQANNFKLYGQKYVNHFDTWNTKWQRGTPFDVTTPEKCANFAKEAVDTWYKRLNDEFDFETKRGKNGKPNVSYEGRQMIWKWTDRVSFSLATKMVNNKKDFRISVFARFGPQLHDHFNKENIFPLNYKKPAPGVVSAQTTGSVEKSGLSVECQKAFQQEALDTVNKYRALHQVKPMSYWEDSNKAAQNVSSHSALKDNWQVNQQWKSMSFRNFYTQRPKNTDYTEAVCAELGSNMVDNWYKLIENYDFATNAPKKGKKFGHVSNFVQIVWKWTERVQFGVGLSKKNPRVDKIFAGAFYDVKEVWNIGLTEFQVFPAKP